MEGRIVLLGAAWGALVGWLSALAVAVPAVITDPGEGVGLLPATALVVIYPVVLGAPVGAVSGAASGLVAALAVGRRTAPGSVLPRVVVGALAVPLVAAVLLRAPALLVPGVAGTALLTLSMWRRLPGGQPERSVATGGQSRP